MANPSIAPTTGIPNFQTPATDPLSPQALASADRLSTQQSANDVVTNDVQAKIQALNTAGSARQNMQATIHTLSQQAQTLSNQLIGDEVAQAKKAVENSGKAV